MPFHRLSHFSGALAAALSIGATMTACNPHPAHNVDSTALSAASPRTVTADTPVRYDVGGISFESRLILPSGAMRGGLLFGPDWYGIYDYPLAEARRFAELGFAVLVVDAYGAATRPKSDDEAGQVSGAMRADRAALRARMLAAHRALLARLPEGTEVSAYGFSFGGLAVLELARAGADLKRVAILSGILDTPAPADDANIRCPVLVLHGTADLIAPMAQVETFVRNMDTARRPYRIELFGGASHAFTNPKFKGATSGPFRWSPDGPIAERAAFAWLTGAHSEARGEQSR